MAAIGAGKLAAKALKGIKKLKRYQRKPSTVPETPKWQKGKQTNAGAETTIGKGLQDKTLTGDLAKVYVAGTAGTAAIDEISKEPFVRGVLEDRSIVNKQTPGRMDGGPPQSVGHTGTSPDKPNVFNGGTNTPPPPPNKTEVETGLGGLWSNMQKPGYWSSKVEGGRTER